MVKNPLVDLAAYIRNMQRKYALSLRQMAERVTQEEIRLSVEKKINYDCAGGQPVAHRGYECAGGQFP